MFNQYKFISCILLYSVLLAGCNKLVEVPPPITGTPGAIIFDKDPTAIAAVTAIYTRMCEKNIDGGEINSLSLFTGLSADEWVPFYQSSPVIMAYYRNDLGIVNSSEYWNVFYPAIYLINSAIEGIERSHTLSEPVSTQLLGEAKFLRGFYYLYLVNLYGKVPLALTTDYSINASLTRADTSAVINQVIKDLSDAKQLLGEQFLDGTLLKSSPDRIRPTRWAAAALLARAYLYAHDYSKAEIESGLVISNTAIFDTVPLNSVFLKNSNEAIWQLPPVINGRNTQDAWTFLLPAGGPDFDHPFYLNPSLPQSFADADQRRIEWIDSVKINDVIYFYPHKYTSATINAPVTEYHTVLRIAEQYLIRAEARVGQANFSGASNDINVIRRRAGLPDISLSDEQSLITEIIEQRRYEFFTEWGHRWMDIRRLGVIDSIMNTATSLKGGEWSSHQKYYPIPQADILANPALEQTDGY